MSLVESENLVEFTTIHSDSIKDIFETLKEMLQDVNIIWKKDCIQITSLNQNKTICVDLKLTKDEISKNGRYECSEEIVTGIHIPTFYKLMKQISKNDTISLTIHKSEPDYLFIRLLNDKKSHYKDLTYRLIDNDSNDEIDLERELDCEFLMLSSDFSKYIKDLSIFSHELEIIATRDQVVFVANGDFGGSKCTIPDEDCILFNSSQEVVQSKFGLKFLQMFTKATNLNQNLKLHIASSPDPLIVEYTIPNMGVLKFYLVPIDD